MRPDPAAASHFDGPKAANSSGYPQIMGPARGMGAGLKTQKATARKAFGWNTQKQSPS